VNLHHFLCQHLPGCTISAAVTAHFILLMQTVATLYRRCVGLLNVEAVVSTPTLRTFPLICGGLKRRMFCGTDWITHVSIATPLRISTIAGPLKTARG